MILSAHQPAYLPWLGYFHKIALADKFVILDAVQFEKNSFTNRNKIKSANGPIWLTTPVLMQGHTGKIINEIEIDNRTNWQKKHWQSILQNYRKAPFFNNYASFFHDIYEREHNLLSTLIEKQFNFFINELAINTEIVKQSTLNIISKKQDLIIDLCNKLDCDTFVFGAFGKNYADEQLFQDKGLKIYFQEYTHPEYNQLWGDFAPYMSVIDVLFNLGSQRAREIILDKNITKAELTEILKKKG